MRDIFITVVCSLLASGGFWSFLQYKMTQREKRETAQSRAIKALLHDRIYEECKLKIRERKISAEDFENLRYIYEPYRELGGNGTCQRLMAEVERLPIVEPEEV